MNNFLSGKKNAFPDAPQGPTSPLAPLGSLNAPDLAPQVIAPGSHDQPKVEVVSHNGTIHKIIVTCPCGKCAEIECEY